MKLSLIYLLLILTYTCNSQSKVTDINQKSTTKTVDQSHQGLENAYLASGCFWCVEEIYESLIGVNEAISGYSGGTVDMPTYRNHADHAEANQIIYDPKKISFKTLVDVYFASQNIEQVNGQGPDHGSSYRSIIFYQNQEQKTIITEKIEQLKQQGFKVAAQVMPFKQFYKAEDYHQDYARLHPNNSYIKAISIPRWKKFAAKMPNVIKPEKLQQH